MAFLGLFCRYCHLQYVLAVYTRLPNLGWLILPLEACGAKVRHENHSDKLLCENFTMKRIFRPKAVLIARRIIRK